MRLLFTYLKAFGALELVSFDLSLARGLDYYTGEPGWEFSSLGVIYEAVLTSNDSVGSIAAGGRYDKLGKQSVLCHPSVGMFSGKDIPAVGVSVGIERVYTIIERKLQEAKSSMRENDTQVFVCANTSDENGYLPERMELANTLWKVCPFLNHNPGWNQGGVYVPSQPQARQAAQGLWKRWCPGGRHFWPEKSEANMYR